MSRDEKHQLTVRIRADVWQRAAELAARLPGSSTSAIVAAGVEEGIEVLERRFGADKEQNR